MYVTKVSLLCMVEAHAAKPMTSKYICMQQNLRVPKATRTMFTNSLSDDPDMECIAMFATAYNAIILCNQCMRSLSMRVYHCW